MTNTNARIIAENNLDDCDPVEIKNVMDSLINNERDIQDAEQIMLDGMFDDVVPLKLRIGA